MNNVVRAVLAVIAAIIFFNTGGAMGQLRSVAGDTVAEAFYQTWAGLFYGLALLSLVIAIPPKHRD